MMIGRTAAWARAHPSWWPGPNGDVGLATDRENVGARWSHEPAWAGRPLLDVDLDLATVTPKVNATSLVHACSRTWACTSAANGYARLVNFITCQLRSCLGSNFFF